MPRTSKTQIQKTREAASAASKKSRIAASAVLANGRDYTAIAREYCVSIVSGAIPACEFIKAACQDWLDELKREFDPGYEYRYDAHKGERVCRYIEKFPHIKGEWANPALGKSKLLVLSAWMVFATVVVFGSVHKVTGLRKIREVYAEIPRKNAKTTLVAAWGHYLAFADGERGAEVYFGASKLDQALIGFDTAAQQIRDTPKAEKEFGLIIGARSIVRMRDKSRIRVVTGKPGDGSSPHGAILDELHEHKNGKLRQAMKQGMGARLQPLLVQITTAGTDISSICYDVRKHAIRVLRKQVSDPQIWALIFTVDDDDDLLSPDAYRKANPNLGVSVYEDDLETARLRAMNDPAEAYDYFTKRLNVWGQSSKGYFSVPAWMKCFDPELSHFDSRGNQLLGKPPIPARFRGKPCDTGYDLAGILDLCSRVKVFSEYVAETTATRQAGMHYYAFADHYLPDLLAKDERYKDTFAKWVRLGWIETHAGVEVQLDDVEQDIQEDASAYEFKSAAFDRMYALQMQQRLSKELGQNASGEDVVCTVLQTAPYLSPPMKEMKAAILAGRFHHNGDPVLAWAVSNVTNERDRNDNDFPRKESPENKIDPVSAMLNALNRTLAVVEDTTSKYETEGALVL